MCIRDRGWIGGNKGCLYRSVSHAKDSAETFQHFPFRHQSAARHKQKGKPYKKAQQNEDPMYQNTFYHLFFLFRLHSSAGIKMDVSTITDAALIF